MRTDWRLIGLLFVAGLFAAAQFAKIALTLEALSAVYPGAPVTFAVSAQAAMGILFGATVGIVVAALGVRRVLLWALLSGAALSGLQALLPPFPVFLLLRFLEGAAHLAIVVSCPTLMATAATPRDIPIAMGIWGTFFGVGFALSAALIPLLGTPQMVLLAHGAGLLALAVALWPVLPRGGASLQTPGEGFIARHVAIYRTPRIFAAGGGFFWHAIMFMGLITFLPGFLGSWTGPVLPIAALAGTFFAGVLARRVPPQQIVLAGYAAGILGMILLLIAPTAMQPGVALPLFVVIGLVPGACFAMIPALNAGPDDQARANGALAQAGNLGTFISVPLFATTLPAGIGGPIWVSLVLSVAALGIVGLIHRQIARTG